MNDQLKQSTAAFIAASAEVMVEAATPVASVLISADGVMRDFRPRVREFFGAIIDDDAYIHDAADIAKADLEYAGLAPHHAALLYTAAPQASQPIGQPEALTPMLLLNAALIVEGGEFAETVSAEKRASIAEKLGRCAEQLRAASNSQPVSGAMTDADIDALVKSVCHSDPVMASGEYCLTIDEVREFLSASGQAGQSDVAEPTDLNGIERYRLQMAAISTAAIGYWKEGDGILPDYDTPALRDVAKLYAKYAALSSTPAQQTEAQVNVQAGMDDKANACIVLEGGAYCLGPCATCDEERLIQKIGSIAINLSRKIMHIVNGTWMPAGAIQIQKKIESLLFNEIRSALAAAPAPVQTEAQQSEKDAERYRKIETACTRVQWTGAGYEWSFFTPCSRDDQTLDAATDAAIAKEKAK